MRPGSPIVKAGPSFTADDNLGVGNMATNSLFKFSFLVALSAAFMRRKEKQISSGVLAFCLHLEVAQVGISWNFLQENL
jgi:hypothetical protein